MRMTRILGKLVAIILMFLSIFGSPPAARSAQVQSLVEGNTTFTLELYSQLKTTPGNLFFSPLQHLFRPGYDLRRRTGRDRKANGPSPSLRQGSTTAPFLLWRTPTPTQQRCQAAGHRVERRQCALGPKRPSVPAALSGSRQGRISGQCKPGRLRDRSGAGQERDQPLGGAKDQGQNQGHPAARS